MYAEKENRIVVRLTKPHNDQVNIMIGTKL